MQFQIQEGYLGMCMATGVGDCGKDATHVEYEEFSETLHTDDIFPDIKGVWIGICDEHCDKNREHKS